MAKAKNRYLLKKQQNEYVIIDKFPEWASGKREVVIERFSEDEYEVAKEIYDMYIEDANNKSSWLDRKEKDMFKDGVTLMADSIRKEQAELQVRKGSEKKSGDVDIGKELMQFLKREGDERKNVREEEQTERTDEVDNTDKGDN